MTFWQPAGLFSVVDRNGDGIVQWADFVVRSTDFVVLSMPEVAGLPFVITGLVMAGGLAAALSTADGLRSPSPTPSHTICTTTLSTPRHRW